MRTLLFLDPEKIIKTNKTTNNYNLQGLKECASVL